MTHHQGAEGNRLRDGQDGDSVRRTRLSRQTGLRITELACHDDHQSFRQATTGTPDDAVLIVSLVRSGGFLLRTAGSEDFIDPTMGFMVAQGGEMSIAHLPGIRDLSTVLEYRQDIHGECPAAGAAGVLRITARVDVAHRSLVAACRAGTDAFEVAERVHSLMARLAGARSPAHGGRKASTAAAHRRLVSRVCAALTDGPPTLGLEELSREAGCSPFHLSRVFRSVTGHTLTGYRNQLRVRAVTEELAAGQPLRELAAKYGFADQAHMTRVFRRSVGELPGAVRALLQRPHPAGKE
ncbi:helix-turn-helix transcriptional regulator [Streptomyces sp. Y1]|uniref:Helix-turn-helix transcriptional regulator n=1 Tax=Streptomyces sp. Y1 TaxID=3238634 RepID=A0AB39TWT0_9ACTN